MITFYLAGRYSRREELCRYREQLRSIGHEVQSRWLDGEHQISNTKEPIGNHGEALVEGRLRSGELLSEKEHSERAAKLREKFALDDWQDVLRADIVVNFTEPPRSATNRGGRHVEFGIAIAEKLRVVVIGYRENIFHWLPQVEFYETWDEFFDKIRKEK